MARIVVAEDDVHVIRLMSMWLKRGGHDVIEAPNGEEAKRLIAEGGVQFLVTDVNMPHCDGIELVQWLRGEFGSDIPVIMISARCDQAQIGEKLNSLHVSVHPKPFSPSRLSNEIEKTLDQFATDRESSSART